ncbi:MAG: hypothetical protein KJO07_20435 [Deltaproteobacteria bacterium]|nr:hypothetical protein [Deltaproteobacteria bacterium]
MRRSLPLLFALAALGCHASQPGGEDPGLCEGASCGAQSKAELLAALADHGDAFSTLLRDRVADDGTIEGDYQVLLAGSRQALGCSEADERSFVVLSNTSMIPKVIFTECSSNPSEASQFFMAAPSIVGGPDMDPQRLHIAAWDSEAQSYRTYATTPTEEGTLRVAVAPSRCLGCHGGPEVLSTWQPLMNEMTNPWTQWNAEPAFTSHFFDTDLDRDIAEGETYRAMLSEQRLGSASELEPAVRAGIDRVTAARLDGRREAADLEASLALLRPLFCDESINFTSEIHRSGELRTAGIVGDSTRNLLAALRPGQWSFTDEDRFRLPLPTEVEETVVLLPVRGESTAAIERALLSRRILEPIDVLRIRAIDYLQPQGSQARCSLFRASSEQLRGRADQLLASIPPGASNGELVTVLHHELLTMLGLARADETLYAVPDADDPAYKAAIQSGDFSGFESSVDALGNALQQRLETVTRGELVLERDRRACDAQGVYPTAPVIPGLRCP